MRQTVLVTGGAGYIGTHAVKALQAQGFEVIVLDSLIYGHRDLVEQVLGAKLIVGEIGDRACLDQLFQRYSVDAVMHFAAFAYVGESVTEPAKYYANNVSGTLTLLQAMLHAGIDKIVFSSTCATYGVPESVPIAESSYQNPINPYGRSKRMVEQILADFDAAYSLKSVCFRYFNAAGADPDGQLGEDHAPETHLIPLVLQAAAGKHQSVSIFGTDYPTPDGTCIRDYIHVTDLAEAHVLGVQHLLAGKGSQTFNLSNGNGFSVREVIDTAEAVTGCAIPVVERARRPGDPPVLVGDSHKVTQMLGWRPRYSDLKDIINHAWTWHQKRHDFGARRVASAPQSTVAKSSTPTVSVIIPAYNAAAFIAQTLESVAAQTYRDLEILVIDDGSSDRTVDIVKQFVERDGRIQLLQQPNGGVAAARNLGIKTALGEFIAPIDADDIWFPKNIEMQLQAMRTGGPTVGLVYSWSADINESGNFTGGFRATEISGDVYPTLIGHNFIGNASATMIRASALAQVGGYNPGLRAQNAQGCEDWDLYLRIAERYEFRPVPEFLVGYRKVSTSMSCDYRSMAKSHELVMASVRRQHPQLPHYLFQLSSSNLYMYFAHQSDRYQRHSTTRFWLQKALAAEAFTPFIRVGFYRLLVSSTWGSLFGRFILPSSRSRETPRPATASHPLPLTLTSFTAPRLTLNVMLVVGNAFHRGIKALSKKPQNSLNRSPSSP